MTFNAPGYRDSESLDDRMSAEQVEASLAAIAGAEVSEPALASVRVTTRGLASSPEGALPAFIIGVDPATELAFSKLGEEVVDGRYLEDGDRLHAFLGQALAERLGLRTGSRMVLTAQAASGDIEGQLVRVVGNLPDRRRSAGPGACPHPARHGPLLAWGGGRHFRSRVPVPLVLHRPGPGRGQGRGGPGRRRGGGWPETSPDLYSALKLDDGGDWAFHVILFAIVALAILNAIFISVLHRKRELGLLRALGLSGRETGLVVYIEGILLTVASGIVGVGLGLVVVSVFFRDGLDMTGLMPEDLNFGGIAFDPVMVPVIEAKHVVQSVPDDGWDRPVGGALPGVARGPLDPAETVKVD